MAHIGVMPYSCQLSNVGYYQKYSSRQYWHYCEINKWRNSTAVSMLCYHMMPFQADTLGNKFFCPGCQEVKVASHGAFRSLFCGFSGSAKSIINRWILDYTSSSYVSTICCWVSRKGWKGSSWSTCCSALYNFLPCNYFCSRSGATLVTIMDALL